MSSAIARKPSPYKPGPYRPSPYKPKILMFGVDPGAQGGISNVVMNWIKADIQQSIDLEYVSTLDNCAAGHYPTKLMNAIRAFWVLLFHNTDNTDLVHIHLSHGMSFYRKLLIFYCAKAKGYRVLVHLHGSLFQEFYELGAPRRKRLITKMFDDADLVLVLSGSWMKFVNRISANTNVKILRNGASINHFGAKIDNGDEVAIVSMGRLGKRKGTYDLLAAFRRLCRDNPKVHLYLGGDGELDRVQKLVKQYGIEPRVDILGWVSGAQKIEVFRKADIYALPSYNEGLPGSILEAMAAGAAIVSTPVGGIPEALDDGRNGYLVAAGDVDALYTRLRELTENAELRRGMGLESRKIISEHFSMEVIVKELVQMYQQEIFKNRSHDSHGLGCNDKADGV